MTSPAPDTSADWGFSDHSVDSAGGLDIGKATAPSDPLSFVPGPADNSTGMPDTSAPSGYPGHGTGDTNP